VEAHVIGPACVHWVNINTRVQTKNPEMVFKQCPVHSTNITKNFSIGVNIIHAPQGEEKNRKIETKGEKS